jgi:uncharacterized SAM-binding protein YcdF (DUF218 family)
MFEVVNACPHYTKLPFIISLLNYFYTFHKQLLVIVIVIAFGLGWVIQSRSGRRWLTNARPILFLSGFLLTLALIFVVLVGKGLFLPSDSGATVNAIVVLGRGPYLREERVDDAAQLWQAKRAPEIFVSGWNDTPLLLQLLKARQIPNQALDGENCSASTKENAIFTAAILNPKVKQRIILITDTPHMWRSLLLFRKMGFHVIPHTSFIPNTWSFQQKASITFRESTLLAVYLLQEIFHLPPSAPEKAPALFTLVQKAKQYGQQRR